MDLEIGLLELIDFDDEKLDLIEIVQRYLLMQDIDGARNLGMPRTERRTTTYSEFDD
jgi:hypothetical protein